MRNTSHISGLCPAALLLLTILLTGCLEQGNIIGDSHGRSPYPCLNLVVDARSKHWHKNNREDIERLKEIAGAKKWRLLVATENSLQVLDLCASTWEELYSTKNRIMYSSLQPGQAVVLLEKSRSAQADLAGEVVVLRNGREEVRIPLTERFGAGYYLGGSPVLLARDYLVYPDGRNAMLYRFDRGQKVVLLQAPRDSQLLTAREAGGLLYLVVCDPARKPARAEMIVLDPGNSFRAVHRVSQVTNLIAVGDSIVVEWNGDICKFDPATRMLEPLAAGALLASVDEYSFLYTKSSWSLTRLGWLALDIAVNEYQLLDRTVSPVGGKYYIDTCYGATFPLVSPDADYVLISDNRDAALVDGEYYVHELKTGEKVGAFYEPYGGKLYFRRVIGWVN